MQNRFDIRETINGDEVIGFTSSKEMKTRGWMDASKVSTYLMDDDGNAHRKHLGMINLFKTTHKVDIPFMKDLFADSAVLECGEGESITYDLPVSRMEVMCYTAVDTSGDSDFPEDSYGSGGRTSRSDCTGGWYSILPRPRTRPEKPGRYPLQELRQA